MARLSPKPIRPGSVRAGDLILCEETHGDIVISRRGRVAKIVHNGSQEIGSSAGGRVLYVYDFREKWTSKLYLLEASSIDTLTELELNDE